MRRLAREDYPDIDLSQVRWPGTLGQWGPSGHSLPTVLTA